MCNVKKVMLLIHGKKTVTIKKHDDYNIQCSNCKKISVRYFIYHEYYHFFFIPIFPSGIKSGEGICSNCNKINNTKTEDYILRTRTPIYFYSWIIIFIGLFTFGVITNLQTQREKKLFIDNPKVGDVYQIRANDNNNISYYFLKVNSIKDDSIGVIRNALIYHQFTSNMDISDFFIANEVHKLTKSDLQKQLEDGIINSVERNYELENRFNIEK